MGQKYVETSRSSPAAVWSVIRLHYFTSNSFLNQPHTMAQKQLSEMTDEELKKNMRMMTIAVTVIIVSIIIMFISAVYSYLRKGFTVTAILPFAFMPIAIINFMNLKKIKAELDSRKK